MNLWKFWRPFDLRNALFRVICRNQNRIVIIAQQSVTIGNAIVTIHGMKSSYCTKYQTGANSLLLDTSLLCLVFYSAKFRDRELKHNQCRFRLGVKIVRFKTLNIPKHELEYFKVSCSSFDLHFCVSRSKRKRENERNFGFYFNKLIVNSWSFFFKNFIF